MTAPDWRAITNRVPRRARRLLFLALAAVVLGYALVPRPPLLDDISFSQAYYDSSRQLLRLSLSADDKYRLRVRRDQVGQTAVDATLLYEDRYFYWHPGVNPLSLARAAWSTLTGDRRIGGSTLTMQVARLRFGIDSRGVGGKLVQMLRALQLEMFYSKDEILAAYLSLAPYGGNIEGIAAASLVYFNKPAERLTLAEALALSVIPQSPARRVPGNPDLDGARRRLAERWIARHPEAEAPSALLQLPLTLRTTGELPFAAPHFVDAVRRESPRDSEVVTTLDLRQQRVLERQVTSYLARKRPLGLRNAVALLVDHDDMAVRAMVGSADFLDDAIHGQVNGTRARRSPGSALKPFIYALGMEQGLVHPLTMLKDAPARFGGFNPENFDHEFAGPVSVHDALIRSRNLPAVQVASGLRDPDLYGFMKQAHVALEHGAEHYGLALALGGAEVSMEELVSLYAMLAHRGLWRPLRRRTDDPSPAGERLLSEAASFLTLDILQDNPRPAQGFRAEWTRDALPVYWKTGTSYGFRDAWAIGIFGRYVLAVWIGNFDGAGNPAFVGVEAAAPLLFALIDALRAEQRDFNFFHATPSPDLASVQVCAVSGQIPGPHCRHTRSTWFVPGVSPIAPCDIHRQVHVDRRGFRACRPDAPGSRAEVYEFWPSDLLKLFRQAGIPRRPPPPHDPSCPVERLATRGNPPQITSPQSGLAYSLRAGDSEPEPIALTAVTDADVRTVYWFLDERFVGRADGSQPLFWPPHPGRFTLRAVDDQGRSDVRALHVQVVR